MKKENKIGKVIAAVGVGAALLMGGALAGATMFPKEIDVPGPVTEKIVEVKVPEPYPVIETVTEQVEVEKLVEVEVPFEDETFKVMACDRLLYEDLTDCTLEVAAEDEALKLALEYVETEFEDDIADELEDEGIVSDEDDVELVKIYDDYEDIEIMKSDYDDDEYRFKFKVKYEDDDKKKYVNVIIEVEDGEVDLKKVVEL